MQTKCNHMSSFGNNFLYAKIKNETNMFVNDTQAPMRIVNMELHPALTNKLFADEIVNDIKPVC